MRPSPRISRITSLWRLPVVLAFLPLVASACSGSALGLDRGCPDNVALNISAGMQPTFSWSPACKVVELQVYREGNVVWTVHAFDGSFGPPVRYGDAPEGATEQIGPEPLQSNRTYRVFIHEPGPGLSLRTVATAEFSPE
jgi:hypothetical protein